MDDDDYYGKNYLMTNKKAMSYSRADIVGRSDMYIYVPTWDKLFYKKIQGSNQFVKHVAGASLFVKKRVFKKVLFPDKKSGVDIVFTSKAIKNKFKIFAASTNDFVVVRRLYNNDHTWKIDLK